MREVLYFAGRTRLDALVAALFPGRTRLAAILAATLPVGGLLGAIGGGLLGGCLDHDWDVRGGSEEVQKSNDGEFCEATQRCGSRAEAANACTDARRASLRAPPRSATSARAVSARLTISNADTVRVCADVRLRRRAPAPTRAARSASVERATANAAARDGTHELSRCVWCFDFF